MPRPRFRGVSHRIAFHIAIVAGIVLVASATGAHAFAATAIYAVTLAGMLGTSATLHRRDWGPRAFEVLRRADHAMIFALMGGTYTAFCVLGVPPPAGPRLLVLAWCASGLGILRAVLWPHAPRAVTSGLYVVVGWVVVAYLPEVHAGLDPTAFALLLVGGIAFTLGAVVYLIRWPDFSPHVFGYHEVFHLMIILGCTCHFAGVMALRS